MDNSNNIIPFDRESDDRKRIAVIEARLGKAEANWTDDSVKLAVAYAEIRDRFPSDPTFGSWLRLNDLGGRYNTHDQGALIAMGRHPHIMREVLEEAASRSYRLIWQKYKHRFLSGSVALVAPEPTSITEPAVPATVVVQEAKPASTNQAVAVVVRSVPVETYPIPARSKLRDLLGAKTADVLHARFRSSKRMFSAVLGESANGNAKQVLNHLATRCQQPDYPADLLLAQTWTPQLLYPHLPRRLADMLPTNLGSLSKLHITLLETERLFMLSPEFGVSDPPLAAFNKAMSIYNSLKHRKAGGTIDPGAAHKPSYGDDEGKPPVVVRGTRLWPAETTAGYRYDDLRCGWGVANDILSAFTESDTVPISTKTLKLRHVRSWLAGGYNSTGSTFEGMLKAFEAVIQAYTRNASEEMRAPLPSMIKNDGDR